MRVLCVSELVKGLILLVSLGDDVNFLKEDDDDEAITFTK